MDEIDLSLDDLPEAMRERMRATRQAVDDRFGPPSAEAMALAARLLTVWQSDRESRRDLLDAMATLAGTIMGGNPAGPDGTKLMMIRFASVAGATAKAAAR